MKNKNHYSVWFLSGVVFWLMVLFFQKCENSKIKTLYKDRIVLDTIVKYDTIKIVKYYKPIKIIDTVEIENLVIRSDTLITTNPFVASIDTNVRRQGIDSLNIKFYYPERIFQITVLKTADTNFVFNKEIIRNIEAQKAFYETKEFSVGVGIIGLLLGIFIAN